MWFVFEAIRTVFDRKRTCPRCRHGFVVRLEDMKKAATCPSCRAKVPAPRDKA